VVDAASGLMYDDKPEPGDATVCLDCGHVMIFGDDMGLRNPTGAETHDLAGDEGILLIQRIRQMVQHVRQIVQHGEE
jgi:hypothetical protein